LTLFRKSTIIFTMKLGKVIRKYRVTNELTLREVSKEIGIGAATLMRLEQGRDPDGPTLVKLIAWLCSDEGKNGSKSKGGRQ
jgi:predicted transcriptional regulator